MTITDKVQRLHLFTTPANLENANLKGDEMLTDKTWVSFVEKYKGDLVVIGAGWSPVINTGVIIGFKSDLLTTNKFELSGFVIQNAGQSRETVIDISRKLAKYRPLGWDFTDILLNCTWSIATQKLIDFLPNIVFVKILNDLCLGMVDKDERVQLFALRRITGTLEMSLRSTLGSGELSSPLELLKIKGVCREEGWGRYLNDVDTIETLYDMDKIFTVPPTQEDPYTFSISCCHSVRKNPVIVPLVFSRGTERNHRLLDSTRDPEPANVNIFGYFDHLESIVEKTVSNEEKRRDGSFNYYGYEDAWKSQASLTHHAHAENLKLSSGWHIVNSYVQSGAVAEYMKKCIKLRNVIPEEAQAYQGEMYETIIKRTNSHLRKFPEIETGSGTYYLRDKYGQILPFKGYIHLMKECKIQDMYTGDNPLGRSDLNLVYLTNRHAKGDLKQRRMRSRMFKRYDFVSCLTVSVVPTPPGSPSSTVGYSFNFATLNLKDYRSGPSITRWDCRAGDEVVKFNRTLSENSRTLIFNGRTMDGEFLQSFAEELADEFIEWVGMKSNCETDVTATLYDRQKLIKRILKVFNL